MDGLHLVIPSHGRAGKVATLRLVPSAMLVVAQSQLAAYRAAYPDAEIDVHPDSVVGLAPKRNWMAERYGSMFSMDDDVLLVHDLSDPPGGKHYDVSDPAIILALIHRAAEQCQELGAYLFGFAGHANPIAFNPMRPFRLTGIVAAHAQGLLAGHGLYWHPRVIADDCWLGLMNAHFHRKVWVDERYVFIPQPVYTSPGGLAYTRTLEYEREGVVHLRRAFGSAVGIKGTGNLLTKNLAHDSEPAMRLPF